MSVPCTASGMASLLSIFNWASPATKVVPSKRATAAAVSLPLVPDADMSSIRSTPSRVKIALSFTARSSCPSAVSPTSPWENSSEPSSSGFWLGTKDIRACPSILPSSCSIVPWTNGARKPARKFLA
jgi:hypothetical protein